MEPRSSRRRSRSHASSSMRLETLDQGGVTLAGGRLAGQDVAHGRVGHAFGAADDAGKKFVFDDAPLGVEFHQRRHHQPVHVGVQAADAVRELQRQHGHGAVGEIDGSAPQARLAVQGGAGLDVVGHIRDVNVEQVVAPSQALDVHRIVKVLRGLAVDGDDGQAAKVAAALAVALGDVLRRRRRPPPAHRRESGAAGGTCG